MAMFSQTTSQRLRSSSPSPSPERSQPLHNFSLPPLLKWGSHKILRSGGLRRGPSSSSSCKPPPDAGIEEIREKLMVHLHTAAKNMKLPVPREGEEGEGEGDGSAAATRPWNLRKRRAACAAPATEEIGEVPSVPAEGQLKSSRLRSMAAERGGGEKRKERRKFSAVLSRDEIEEDFFIITGSKPSRRPKKRSRIAQKQVEMASPAEVTMRLVLMAEALLLRVRAIYKERLASTNIGRYIKEPPNCELKLLRLHKKFNIQFRELLSAA